MIQTCVHSHSQLFVPLINNSLSSFGLGRCSRLHFFSHLTFRAAGIMLEKILCKSMKTGFFLLTLCSAADPIHLSIAIPRSAHLIKLRLILYSANQAAISETIIVTFLGRKRYNTLIKQKTF